MQRRSNVNISSLIVFFSIVTILIEFVLYYFFASVFLILGISGLTLFICCHILVERATTYEVCFIYSLLNIFICLIVTLMAYFEKDNTLSILPYTNILIGIVILNWIIPSLHCFIRYMLDYGTRVINYSNFYRNNSIIFVIFYLTVIIYVSFFATGAPWESQRMDESINILPFFLIAAQIEDYIHGLIPLKEIIIYLSSRILIFIPFGYYIALITRKHSRILRLLILLLFPLIIETLQYFILSDKSDIDDVIYGLLGGLLGVLIFFLMNTMFRAVSGKNFLLKETGYRFSNHTLRF